MGEKDGVSVAIASVTEPEIASCWSSFSLSTTSIVKGSALTGRMLRAAVTMIAPSATASAGTDRAWTEVVSRIAVVESRVGIAERMKEPLFAGRSLAKELY